jgi:hypothetical protein
MKKIFPITGYPAYRYAATQAAFAALLARWPQTSDFPSTVVETFAGVGGQTKLLNDYFGQPRQAAFEKDMDCFNLLVDKVSECRSVSAFRTEYARKKVPFEINSSTLLVVDGAYTLSQHKDYGPFLHKEAGHLILCEQARARLHLHRKNYGIPEGATYEEYLCYHVAPKIGRPYIAHEVTKYSPSYVLFGPSL